MIKSVLSETPVIRRPVRFGESKPPQQQPGTTPPSKKQQSELTFTQKISYLVMLGVGFVIGSGVLTPPKVQPPVVTDPQGQQVTRTGTIFLSAENGGWVLKPQGVAQTIRLVPSDNPEQKAKVAGLEVWFAPGLDVTVKGKLVNDPKGSSAKVLQMDEMQIHWQKFLGHLHIDSQNIRLEDPATGEEYVLRFERLPEQEQKNLKNWLEAGKLVDVVGVVQRAPLGFSIPGHQLYVKGISPFKFVRPQ